MSKVFASLLTLKFFNCFKNIGIVAKESNFSIKSEGIAEGDNPFSYTE